MGTTDRLFGEEAEEQENGPQYTEDESETDGRRRRLAPGQHFLEQPADLLFKKEYLKNPAPIERSNMRKIDD